MIGHFPGRRELPPETPQRGPFVRHFPWRRGLAREAFSIARDLLLRMLPHRAPTGLFSIGHPGRDAPVLLTGNYTLTVRRLRGVLRGHDAWLLVADSKGINVWCAAGGGHLTHHDIIAALRTSRVAEVVDHRELILPQLCATGVERRRITEATSFNTRWGPARLEDLPAFLERGRRVRNSERFMRFPARERQEMAAMWGIPMLLVAAVILGAVWGWATLLAGVVAVAGMIAALFALLPRLKLRRRHWPVFAAFALAAALAGIGILALLGAVTPAHAGAVAGACALAMALLAIDVAGTTPWYPSQINTRHNELQIELVKERCTGETDCVQVCPTNVLWMNGRRRKVEIRRPEQCIQCGACIVQCPRDALRFRGAGGIIEAAQVRATRLNLLGRRTIPVQA